ncbi:8-amino-7-oxononanoate synthase [Rhizobium sp. Root708]|uniref:8-amino-7-oxononanoate synthase n=1 Tax=Rhizobium sp. Root708 TaxID=1736592 RepID=UPI0006F685FF|nr:8-amino-7-oxononanoate synthase [Rhizobium sp. Root708]KRB49041.1 8-amino-7-oxononanoate synthase [Rhizobium sp. Root708]
MSGGSLLSAYAATLDGLERKSRRRYLTRQEGVDFTSNDFLALADDARIRLAIAHALQRGVPMGSGGSRLLRGNHPEHEALELEAAKFFGAERALFFASGYVANSALFSTLPRREDLIVYDALLHASALDGISASKSESHGVRHNDVTAFDDAIKDWRRRGGKGRPWIATESIFSMDGDRGAVEELATLADHHDGFLVVDEAHATGVFGKGGRGLACGLEGKENVLVLHTCGKALGVSGAILSSPAVLVDYMINRARSFIYSTAPSPLLACAVREALKIIDDEPLRQKALHRLIGEVGDLLAAHLGIAPSGSQVQPIIIGDSARTVKIARELQSNGFDVRAIRPPTVPEGTSRLRLSITLHVAVSQVNAMLGCLADVLKVSR